MRNNQDLRTAVEQNLEPVIRRVMETFALAGLAVGVVKDGELVYARGFGVRSVQTQEPVTPHSLFHMASVSKPFVATAIMQLVEQGKLELDTPIGACLPYFKLADERAGLITVRQMLSHTAGMPDEADYHWYQPEDDDGALERYVRSLAGEQLIADPGEKFAYSNIAYEVLGDIIAKVSGRTFEDYVQASVLDPLGMADSTFLRRSVAPELATSPHFGLPLAVLPGAYPYHRAHAPSSTLHSNIVDMATWALASLNRGELNGRRLLQPSSYDLLWREHARVDEDSWEQAVGLGWFFGTYHDQRVVHHGGTDPGFETQFVLLPDINAAVVVLANSNTAPVDSLKDATLDVLLGLQPGAPEPPVAVTLAPVLANEGIDAAIQLYHHLQATRPGDFNFDAWPFINASWGAVDLRHAEHVLPLLRLCVALHPDSSDAHAVLGHAYLTIAESESAIRNLRRALSLNPDNTYAAGLLHKLTGP